VKCAQLQSSFCNAREPEWLSSYRERNKPAAYSANAKAFRAGSIKKIYLDINIFEARIDNLALRSPSAQLFTR
jgi:hypothetical protein